MHCASAQVMCCDYGFRSNAGRLYQEGYGQIPKSAWGLVRQQLAARRAPCSERSAHCPRGLSTASCSLLHCAAPHRTPLLLVLARQAWSNFQQEYRALRRSFREDEYGRIADAAPPQGLVGKVRTRSCTPLQLRAVCGVP